MLYLFNTIASNTVDTNSMVNVGENQQAGWFANQKRVANNGLHSGITWSQLVANGLMNNVVIDSPAYVPTFNISPQNQTL